MLFAYIIACSNVLNGSAVIGDCYCGFPGLVTFVIYISSFGCTVFLYTVHHKNTFNQGKVKIKKSVNGVTGVNVTLFFSHTKIIWRYIRNNFCVLWFKFSFCRMKVLTVYRVGNLHFFKSEMMKFKISFKQDKHFFLLILTSLHLCKFENLGRKSCSQEKAVIHHGSANRT